MKLITKITSSLLFIGITLVLSGSTAFAQSALDDIRTKFEAEGIPLIDYSSPEGRWGSLSSELELVSFLSQNYEDLADLAEDFEEYYVGPDSITDLKRQLAIATAEKTRLTNRAEIDEKDNEIEILEEDIKDAQEEAKEDIADIVSGAPLNQTEGVNLIFNEVDFYFNHSKWGRLPLRIIGLLEEEGYESLQDVVDLEGLENLESALGTIDGLSADDIEFITDSIAILSASGERQALEITRTIANTIRNIIAAVAIIWIVIAGARMIFAQGDENVITEQKRSIIYGIVGLVAILLIDRGIDVLYGPAGAPRTELTPDQGFTTEVYGIVTFIRALVGTIAIFFIVVSGLRMIFSAGDEQQITNQKRSILWVAVGIILIAVDQILVENIFIIPVEQGDVIKTSNIVSVVNTISSVIQFILGFVGLVAFGALIYGAATMVMNYGNDEMVEKSKKIIRNAIIGILVILSAYTIIATLVVFN